MGSPGYYSRVIPFWPTPRGRATVVLASLLLSGAPVSAATRTIAAPPVFPLALAQQVVLPAPPVAAPSVGAGLAVIVLPEGDVVALDLASGAERWRAALKATHRAIASGDAVYLVTVDSTECLALADGAVRWRTPRTSAATAPPLVTDRLVVVASAQPALLALRRDSGASVWARAIDAPVSQPLIATTDRVFGTTADHRVLALDASTGAVQWSLPFTAPLAALAESDGLLYVGSDDNFFYAVDASTGRIKWKWRTGADVVGAAAVDADQVYFASLDNVLRALDRHSGAQRWKRPLPTRSVAGPLLIDDVLLIVGYSPEIRGHLPGTGASAGRYGADGEIAFQPAFMPGSWSGADRLVVVTFDSTLLVLRRRLDPPTAPLEALPGTLVTASDPPAPAAPPPPPPPLPLR